MFTTVQGRLEQLIANGVDITKVDALIRDT
jgi:hypothetical protein